MRNEMFLLSFYKPNLRLIEDGGLLPENLKSSTGKGIALS